LELSRNDIKGRINRIKVRKEFRENFKKVNQIVEKDTIQKTSSRRMSVVKIEKKIILHKFGTKSFPGKSNELT
jgi:hypothetical protein